MARKQLQAGSVHLIVTVILAVALVGTLGWIFWQNFSKKNDKSSESSSIQVEKADNVEPEVEKLDLEIEKWGVGAEYDTSVAALSYKIENNMLMFVGTDLMGSTECTYNSAGVIVKYSAQDKVYPYAGSSEGEVAAKDAPDSYGLKKVGDSFYKYTHPQSICSEQQLDEQQAAIKAVQDIFENLELV